MELTHSKLELKEKIINIIRTVFDPEIPVNIYELGLIYSIDIDKKNRVEIKMTLTSPNCPVAESLPEEVAEKTKSIEGISDVSVEIVWDPPWNPQMMSEEAKFELGFM
jgi:FeS assembly SUF system protein